MTSANLLAGHGGPRPGPLYGPAGEGVLAEAEQLVRMLHAERPSAEPALVQDMDQDRGQDREQRRHA